MKKFTEKKTDSVMFTITSKALLKKAIEEVWIQLSMRSGLVKFLPWTFYTMTWQKSVVSSTDKKVETSHENFVNWTLTTYFVRNSRLTPLDGFTAAIHGGPWCGTKTVMPR